MSTSGTDTNGDKEKQEGNSQRLRKAPEPAPTLTTKEDWFRFVDAEPPGPPVLPPREEYDSWSAARRRRFDHQRRFHHDDFGFVSVPDMQRVHRALLPQIVGNTDRPPGARRGGIVDGHATVGKTTIITQLGRKYHRYMRGRYPHPRTAGGGQFIPVVYVTLPAATTIKGLNRALAHFYGIVTPKRMTTDELGLLIEEHARRCSTGLILVDDIHFLNLHGNKEHRAVNDHLKYLANAISATFVYAGIECEKSGLLSEGGPLGDEAYAQTGRRFAVHRVRPFSRKSKAGQKEWVALLKSLEARLVLFDARPGVLYESLPGYLFERTGGYMGSLAELIRRGANLAIDAGEERITEELLDGVFLDHVAEHRAGRKATA